MTTTQPQSGECFLADDNDDAATIRRATVQRPMVGLGGTMDGLTGLCPWVFFFFCFLFDLPRRTFQPHQ